MKLFRYPCVSKAAKPRTYVGHASHVTNVAFSAEDRFVLSAGGNDKCIIQWRVVGGGASS